MNLPQLEGSLDQTGFFIFAAADSRYFTDYGVPLINSVLRNTPYGVHLHIYDPTDAQIAWCQSQSRVSITWERLLPGQFDSAIARWSRTELSETDCARKNKMLGIKGTGEIPNRDALVSWIYKTYYACMRFVRLAEILDRPREFLAIDVDGLVRSEFSYRLEEGRDFFLYQKEKGGHLAGAILATERTGSFKFFRQLGEMIEREIRADNTYWFLDQHCLDEIVDHYKKGLLPINYIDWHMEPASAIWSAKGKRKFRDIFQRELDRYR